MSSLIPDAGTNPWDTAFKTLWNISHNDDGSLIPVVRGTGSPEGVRTDALGTVYERTDGDVYTSMYIKTTASGTATGWTALQSAKRKKVATLTYGTSVAVDTSLADYFILPVTDSNGITFTPFSNAKIGSTFQIDIQNTTTGAMGLVNWPGTVLLEGGAYVAPDPGGSTISTFVSTDGIVWKETSRSVVVSAGQANFDLHVGSVANPTNLNRITSVELWNGGRQITHSCTFIGGNAGTTWALIEGSSSGIGAASVSSYWNPALGGVAARVTPVMSLNCLPYGGLGARSPDGVFDRDINGATNANPIVISTTAPHGLTTGDTVTIYNVGGNTAANGTRTITNVDTTHFSIAVAGNNNYTSGGRVAVDMAINAATNATPIKITTVGNHRLTTGDRVTVYNVAGNTAANGAWNVTVTSATQFTLNTSVGNGAYTSGGVLTTRSTMTRGAAGDYDSHFTTIGNAIKAQGLGVLGKEVVLRLMEEHNLTVFPWSIRGNGTAWGQSTVPDDCTTANFIAYWRRIVNVLTPILPYALFGWNPHHNQPDSTSTFGGFTAQAYTASSYPGDAYVDICSMDLYDVRGARYTITNVTNNGSGLIKITIGAGHNVVNGDSVDIESVGGTTEANGTWQSVSGVTATTFDLVGSTFTNAWTSGGFSSWGTTRAWLYHTNGNIGIQGVGLDWIVAFANAHGKALALDEWGLWRPQTVPGGVGFSGGDNAKWIVQMAAYLRANQFAYACYFDGASDNSIAAYNDTGTIASDDPDFPVAAAQFRTSFA